MYKEKASKFVKHFFSKLLEKICQCSELVATINSFRFPRGNGNVVLPSKLRKIMHMALIPITAFTTLYLRRFLVIVEKAHVMLESQLNPQK